MATWLRIVLGIGILVLAFFLLVDVQVPSRPERSIDALREPRDKPLNVVFILIDTLRADRLSAYGYERETTPLIAKLAESAVRFANVDSQSTWTKCSMASLWTGLFPNRTGVVRFSHAIPADARMPAEILHDAGYATAGIYRNGWVDPSFGFGQGFDLYVRPKPRADEGGGKMAHEPPGTRKVGGSDLDATRAALEFLQTTGDRPFFLYVHYMDVHQYAYDPAAAELGWGGTNSDAYDAALHWTDRNVATIVAELEERRLLGDTLVVIAADHGEAFNEHGQEGHARNLFREVTTVPLFFLLPFRLPEPVVVEPLVRNVDIWPTIFDILGIDAWKGVDGQSLVPLMEAAARGETLETPLSLGYIDQTWGQIEREPAPLVSIHDPATGRVAWNVTRPERSLRVYDRRTDPREQNNLASQLPDWAVPLQHELESRLETKPEWGEPEAIEVDEMQREHLRALGYVDK